MNRIKELRKEHKITQEKLAAILGISRSAIAMYETEKCDLSNDILIACASFFDVSTDYLLGQSDIKKAPSYEDAGLSAEEAVIENADFVRYIVTFRGSFFSFSYTFPTSIKTLYNIFPVISFTMYLSP